MNKKSECSMDDYVEQRLVEWAEWFGRYNHAGIGFPNSSVIRMFMEGAVIKKKKRKFTKLLPTHEAAEELEACIMEMHKQNSLMATAIRLHYLDHLSMRSHAKALNLSHTNFKVYIRMGKQWLAGQLTTVNKKI